MKLSKPTRKISFFLKHNLFVITFLLIIGFVGIIVAFKFFNSQKKQLYVKVQVSQGLWWASTKNPSLWLVKSLQKGDMARGITGKPDAEIMDVTYYPLGYRDISNSEYDLFLIIKLNADYNKANNTYSYKRSRLAVGAPIDFDFSRAQTSATIIDISSQPFRDDYKDIDITIFKSHVTPEAFNSIQVGDSYFDGNKKTLEIISKKAVSSEGSYIDDQNYISSASDLIDVEVNLRILIKKQQGIPIYQEMITIMPGKLVDLATNNYYFDQYKIIHIE